MIMNRMDLKRWSRDNPNCMYFDLSLHLPAQALLCVSHENRVAGNGRYLASTVKYSIHTENPDTVRLSQANPQFDRLKAIAETCNLIILHLLVCNL